MWMGIDLGTQSVRAVVAADDGEILGSGSAPLTGRRDGVRHEQRPLDWWTALCAASRQALRDCPAPRALAVCATSGTVLLGDREGRPLTPGVMYDDGRAVAEAARAKAPPSWALPKVMWLLKEHGAGAGDAVRVMHQADLVLARLAGTPLPTDSSHALKTGYDLERDDWPRRRFAKLGLPDGIFPDVVRPGTRIGEVGRAAAEETGIPAGTAVVAGMTDGCAAQLASGSLAVGSWNSVLGTTLVLKGVTSSPVEDPAGVVYNHRAPDGTWLPGGASGVGGGVLTAAFPALDPIRMDALARDHEPARVVAYPLVATGERFPFVAPEATGFLLGEPASDAEHWLALLTGVGLVERLCFDYLDLLGAQNYGRLHPHRRCGPQRLLEQAARRHPRQARVRPAVQRTRPRHGDPRRVRCGGRDRSDQDGGRDGAAAPRAAPAPGAYRVVHRAVPHAGGRTGATRLAPRPGRRPRPDPNGAVMTARTRTEKP